jgi:hypothetical protein
VKAAKFPQLTEFYRKSEKEYRVRSSGVQEFRSSGVQEFRSSGVQEFRSSGVQEFRVGEPGELQARKVARAHMMCRQRPCFSAFGSRSPELLNSSRPE